MPIDPSLISAGIGAVGGAISSLFGHKKSSHVDPSGLSNSTGGDLLNFLSDAIKNKSLNFSSLVDKLSTLAKDKGYYANSALSYYLENEAFEKQLNYNTMAMEKQYQYQNASMKKQFFYDVNMQNRSYEMSRNLQNEQNAWSKMMSDTSHQREVADLRSAGLNPILSANGGANAYTSGSAIIGGNTPSPSNPSALPISKPDYSKVIDALIRGQQVRNDTNVANAEVVKKMKEAENLDWTIEGIRRRSANAVSDFIEGIDYDKGVSAEIKNLTSGDGTNAFTKFLSDVKSSGLVRALLNGFKNNYKSYESWMKSIKDATTTARSSSSPDSIIKTKYGDLIDIDDFIRRKYNVGTKIRGHR